MVLAAKLRESGRIRLLDPAVGDGALLDALIKAFPIAVHQRIEVIGYDTNADALLIATRTRETWTTPGYSMPPCCPRAARTRPSGPATSAYERHSILVDLRDHGPCGNECRRRNRRVVRR
jgi:hypothetical protein